MAVGAGDRQIAITMPASALRLKWLAYFRPVVQMPADSAELCIVGGGQRLGIVVDANHSRHGSRDFLARDPHLLGRVGEQRRLLIESRRIAFETLAAKDQLAVIFVTASSTLFNTTGIEVAAHCECMSGCD